MAEASVTIDFSQFARASRYAQAKGVQAARMPQYVAPIVYEFMGRVHKAAQVYPPPLPKQKYIRTYKLRHSWRMSGVTVSADEVRGSVYSDGSARSRYGEYAPYVMDAARQAFIHRGRWHTTKSMAEDVNAPLRRALERRARQLLETPVT